MKKIFIIPAYPSLPEQLVLKLARIPGAEVVVLLTVNQIGTSENVSLGNNVHVREILKSNFGHGSSRNTGARIARELGGQLYCFLTQDIELVSSEWISHLSAPIEDARAAATFARQLPRQDAAELERFSRYFNYPSRNQFRTLADVPRLGVKAFFFSNVCSAVCADAFWEVGGFPEDVIMNEDMVLAARLLRAGQAIEYVAEAAIVHSHDYTLKQQFQRNFDVGAFFAEVGPVLQGANVGGEGLRFVREQLRYVYQHGRSDLIPLVIVEAAAKFAAFQAGKRHRILPLSLKKRFSMHSYHWDQYKETL